MLIKHDEAPIIPSHDLETSPCDLPCERAVDAPAEARVAGPTPSHGEIHGNSGTCPLLAGFVLH